MIEVTSPVLQTEIFAAILLIALAINIKKRKTEYLLDKKVSEEVKGLAILAIVLSHIGYFLVNDTRFLFPFSVLAGVGVNLFLILSGYGLTVSAINRPLTIGQFYRRRMFRLFVSMWIVLGFVLLIDGLAGQRFYPLPEVIKAFSGWFPRANLWIDVDSPLWYFSLILFYYLIFPIFFHNRWRWLAPVLLLIAGVVVLKLPLPVDEGVRELYEAHDLTFPLGVLLGITISKWRPPLNIWIRGTAIFGLLIVIGYTAIHSGVGEGVVIEENISIVTSLAIIVVMALARVRFGLLSLMGMYSYEIYLMHWPILARFNVFAGWPAAVMVWANLVLIIGLSYLLAKASGRVVAMLNLQYRKQ